MTNIIDIYFDSVGSTATAPSKLWQWSKGQVVRINGIDLPTVYQVHFSSNPTLGTAEPVAVSGNMVSIPDIYLTTGEPVYLFIWLSDETSAETIRKGTIYVAKRSQPSGEYDPTAEQQTIIDGLIGSINTAVDTAEGYANSAQTYSGNAATSATEALNAKDAAQGYAEQASQTAQGVEILVNRAEDAADDAETAKQDVEQLKQAVEGFANDAESAKTDAETARGEAQGFAQTASAKASEALQSASQASQSTTTATAQAQTATAKATEASQSAETATTKASEATASATTATTKASEASASASTATTAKNDAVTAKNAAVTARTGAETARTGAETAAQSVSASAAQIATNTSDIADLKEDLGETTRNLFTGNISAFSGMEKESDGDVVNTLTDTRSGLLFIARFRNDSTIVDASNPLSITSTGRRSVTVTTTGSGNNIMLLHSGSQRNLSFTIPFNFSSGETYTISFDVDGYNVQTVGGLILSKIQIETGSTATEYYTHLIAKDPIARKGNATNAEAIQTNAEAIQTNAEIIQQIKDNIHFAYFDTTFTIGTLTGSGAESDSTSRVRSGYIPTANEYVNVDDGYRYAIHYYTSDTAAYSSDHDYWLTGKYQLKTAYPYFRYVVEKIPAAIVQQDQIETYGNSVCMDLRSQLTDDIDSIDARVTALEDTDPLPDYWSDYLTAKIPTINEEIYKIGNHGIAFTFFTDYHYKDSEVNYQGFTWLPNILKRIKTECPVEDFIFGGDILDTESTRASALAILEKYREDYNFLNIKNINGNHDNNPYGAETLSIDDVYSILFRGMGMEKSVHLMPKLYWHSDNETQKVRIIALNTGTGGFNTWAADAEQHRWIVETLNTTPTGYTIVVMPHVFFGLSDGTLVLSAIGENIKTLIDAYVNRGTGTWNATPYDFTSASGTVACIMSGHTHNDGMIESNAGYPMIGTVCDAMWGSQQNVPRGTSARGTTAEHAFDVVCIDTTAKTIKCVRVGSGTDRTYTY